MSIGFIFSITVLFLLVSALGFATTAAADLRRANTAKRLQSLRGQSSKTVVVASDTDVRDADPLIIMIPLQFRPNLKRILESAGHTINLRLLILIALVCAPITGFFFQFFFQTSLWLLVLVSIAGGLFVPYQVVRIARARMKKKFLALFPDSIDLIVRAVRAGLPISAALDAVGKEMADPAGKEFRLLMADMKIGMTFEEAMRRAADRVHLLEFSFFTASLILQRETGGNLSETLETLGTVLRKRQEMTLKINTLTSEARTSAYVMTALPFVVATALYFVSPGYLNVYVTDPRGHVILGGALLSLLTGIGVMSLMLNRASK